MPSAMAAFTHDKAVTISLELERRRHFLIGQRPVAVEVVQVLGSFLQEDFQWFLLCLSNQKGVDMAAANIDIASDVTDDLAESIGSFPGGRESGDRAGTDAANGASGGIF